MYSTTKNPIAIIEYCSGHEAKIVKEFDVPYVKPMRLVVDYMLKQINDIDKVRKELREKYPNFLSKL